MHAWGLRLRGVLRMLAIAHPSVLPSAMRNDVGTPVAIISQLNTQPACAPVNASPTALQLPTHDSGSGWLATPFLCDSFIHNSTPVYPGALRNLLEVATRSLCNLVRSNLLDLLKSSGIADELCRMRKKYSHQARLQWYPAFP